VIVTDNLFGDILSDLAPAWSRHRLRRQRNIHPGGMSIFEPVHGSPRTSPGRGGRTRSAP